MQQPLNDLQKLCGQKKANLKRLHTVLFHSHNILETEEIEKRLVVPGAKVEMGMGGRWVWL